MEIVILDPAHNKQPGVAAGSLTVSGTVLCDDDVDEIQIDGWMTVHGFRVPLVAGPVHVPAPGGPPPQGAWTLDFQNVPPGTHQLKVRATARDESGNWYHGNDEVLVNVVDQQAAEPEAVPVTRARRTKKKQPRSR